jgi:hypothetical protein
VGNGQKLAGHEGMQNGQNENQGGDHIERLLLNTIFQNGPDAFQLSILITFQAAGKGDGFTPVWLARNRNLRPQEDHGNAAEY